MIESVSDDLRDCFKKFRITQLRECAVVDPEREEAASVARQSYAKYLRIRKCRKDFSFEQRCAFCMQPSYEGYAQAKM